MKAIAMIEFRSIARGIEVADLMVKTAKINLLRSSTICPGKYFILVSGDTASVTEALQTGISAGSPYVVGHEVIPNIDPLVIEGIEGCSEPKAGRAVGILEYYDVIDAIIGADLAVKAANVSIIEIRLGFAIGGKGFTIITGEISEVTVAINVAKKASAESGMLMECSIIHSIDPDVYAKLF